FLSLPALPPLDASTPHWELTRLPAVVASAVSPDQGWDEAQLAALLRSGLPLEVRAQLGRALASMDPSDPKRQQLHALLALGLVRLGIVIQQCSVLERAAYELD